MLRSLLFAFLSVALPAMACAQAAPQSEQVDLQYYDSTQSRLTIETPFVQGETALIGLGQRFTVPAANGELDSLRIRFYAGDGDIARLLICKDVVMQTAKGPRHLPDTSLSARLATIDLPLDALIGDTDVTMIIPMNKLQVPHEFHVLLAPPMLSPGEFTSTFSIFAQDRRYTEPSFNSRSIGLFTPDFETIYPDVLDGFFTYLQVSMAVDLYIDAYVTVDKIGVRRTPETAQRSTRVLERGSTLHFQEQEMMKRIVLTDLLGTVTAEWYGANTSAELTTAHLGAGVHFATITTVNGVRRERILVR